MKGKLILLILCTAAVLSCSPIQGLLPGGDGGSQSQAPNSGTIKIRQHSSVSRPDPEGEDLRTIEHLVTIELVNGQATASISYDEKHHAQSHTENGIVIIDTRVDETTHAEGKSLPATIRVEVDKDGTYTISYQVSGIKGTWKYDGQSSGRCVIPSRDCGVPQNGRDQRSARVNDVGGVDGDITGHVDSHQPRAYSGSTTEIVGETTGLERAITWDLRSTP